MVEATRQAVVNELRQIPGVGKKTAGDLWELGIRSIADLKDKDPGELYSDLCNLRQIQVNRGLLYVFRCAVYYASHEKHDPELLKWWSWKDEE